MVLNIDGDDLPTDHFKVSFGENSLWEGTFEGDFENGTSKEWKERINIKHAKEGIYIAKSTSLFSSAIYCFSQAIAIQDCFVPLAKIVNKDLTIDTTSDEDIQELSDSLQSQKRMLQYSLLKLNQLEEFDRKIPLKKALIELYKYMIIVIDEDLPNLLITLKQSPSLKKSQQFYFQHKPFVNKFEKLNDRFKDAYQKFENKHILFTSKNKL